MIKLIAVTAMVLLLKFPAQAGSIDFYEGPNGTQTKHCTLADAPNQDFNLKKKGHPCPNDEIKSLVLNNVRPGAVITLYDDPKGDCNKDDCVEITVKRPIVQLTIGNLQQTVTNSDDIVMNYHGDNGLNGRVSHITIR